MCVQGTSEGQPRERKTMDGAEATRILLASKVPPPKETPDQVVERGRQMLLDLVGGAPPDNDNTSRDGGDAEEPHRSSRVEFEVFVDHPAVLARLLDAGRNEDPGFHAPEVSALFNIPRGVMPLYRLAKRALGRQSGLMGEALARKGDSPARNDCVDATDTVGDKSRCRELVNGLCHLVDALCKCCAGETTFDSIRIGRVVFFRGLLEEVRINILKATPTQTPEQTEVMLAWWQGISVLQGDEPR